MRHLATIKEYTKKIAKEMNVRGLMNMQYAIADDKVYVLEANPRASRTVPLVSKVCNINMVKIATDIVTRELTGRDSPVPTLTEKKIPHIGVKQAVFPFNMFPEVDPILGPEMRSTGEVLGLASSYGAAMYKAEEGAKTILPTEGKVLFSVNDLDKPQIVDLARGYYDAGFEIVATGNTYKLINEAGIPVTKIKKIHEGQPNISDALINGDLAMIVNTPHGKQSAHDDSYIRKTAIKMRIPYMTNIAAAKASFSAKTANISAIPESPNFRIPVRVPRDTITVPHGSPGVPMEQVASKILKINIVPGAGTEPYRIREIIIAKNTSASTEPQ